jgi:AcrR family transcriptional regulator
MIEPALKPGVEDTRLRILAAARKLYAEKGSRGTTTREVADLAGVNEATLFRHFGTKQQLLSAMLDHFAGVPSFTMLLEHVRSARTLEEQLQRLGLEAVEAMRRKEDLMKVGMAEEITNPEAGLCAWRGPAEARRVLAAFMAEKIAADELHGEPEMLARTFMSLFFAYVMARRLWHGEERPTEHIVATIVDLFLNGARVR